MRWLPLRCYSEGQRLSHFSKIVPWQHQNLWLALIPFCKAFCWSRSANARRYHKVRSRGRAFDEPSTCRNLCISFTFIHRLLVCNRPRDELACGTCSTAVTFGSNWRLGRASGATTAVRRRHWTQSKRIDARLPQRCDRSEGCAQCLADHD